MLARFLSLLGRLARRLRLGHEWFPLVVAGFIGVVMSGVAMAFILPLRWAEETADELALSDRAALLFLTPLAPVAGALICGLVKALIRADSAGYGVPSIMYAIHRRQGRVPLRQGFAKWLASTATIGAGGSAGPEGPIVVIGASIGSTIGRAVGAPAATVSTFLGCAAAAGIASVFNAPFAGIFFTLEVLLRDFSLRTFTPIVIAAVISSATTQAVLGSTPLFGVGPHFFTSGDKAFTLLQIPNYIVLGALAAAFSAAFIRAMRWTEGTFARLPVPAIVKPATGAALLGLMGLAYLLAAPQAGGFVPFYGNGYSAIRDLLEPHWYFVEDVLRPVGPTVLLLLTITLLKAVATMLTLGSGGSGGLFAPALLLGAGLGAAVGHLVAATGWHDSASPAHYALVGMAAMVAATSHAPLTAILLVYEITRSYEIMLPLMMAAVIATIVGRLLCPHSVYTGKLAELGVRIGGTSDLTLLRRLTAADVPLLPPVVARPHESAERLVQLAEETGVGDFVVLDDADRYVGMVTGVDLRRALVYREAIPLMQVDELTRRDLPTVRASETLDVVLDKFNAADVHCLVVLNDKGEGSDGKVRGVLTRSRTLRRYQQMLGD